MKTKIFLMLEVILLLGIFSFLFFSTAPKQLFPLHGMTISNEDFLFEIENSKEIFLSTDEAFANYFVLKEGEEIVLYPGTYFWKVKGILRDSEVRNFTLESTANLVLRDKGEVYEIQNVGNVDLNLTKEQDGKVVGTILAIGESKEFEKDTSIYTGGAL